MCADIHGSQRGHLIPMSGVASGWEAPTVFAGTKPWVSKKAASALKHCLVSAQLCLDSDHSVLLVGTVLLTTLSFRMLQGEAVSLEEVPIIIHNH